VRGVQPLIPVAPTAPVAGPNKRLCSLDALKLIGCVSVVLLHALVPNVERVDDSLTWVAADLLSAATRQAVPLFFMISGALMLRRDFPSLPAHFGRVALRYGLPLLGGLVTYKALAISQGDPTGLFNTVFYNVRANLGFHLWFMWEFLGLALVAPILRPIAADKRAAWLFVALWAAYCVVAPWLRFLDVTIPVANMLFFPHTGYFILGYLLAASPRRVPPLFLVCGMGVAIVATAGLTADFSLPFGRLDVRFYDPASPLVLLLCACLFKLCLQGLTGPSPKALRFLAGATFTVYIYHVLALSRLTHFIGPTSLFMSVCVHTPLAFAACLLLYAIGSRVPGMKYFFPG